MAAGSNSACSLVTSQIIATTSGSAAYLVLRKPSFLLYSYVPGHGALHLLPRSRNRSFEIR